MWRLSLIKWTSHLLKDTILLIKQITNKLIYSQSQAEISPKTTPNSRQCEINIHNNNQTYEIHPNPSGGKNMKKFFIKFDPKEDTYRSTLKKKPPKINVVKSSGPAVKTILRPPVISTYAKGISGLPTRQNSLSHYYYNYTSLYHWSGIGKIHPHLVFYKKKTTTTKVMNKIWIYELRNI